MKSTKHLIMKVAPSGNIDCKEFDRALFELRNTPTHTGRSTAQVLYGRPLRSCVPAHASSFQEQWQARTEECDRRAAQRAQDVTTCYDQHARPLPELRVNDHVRIQDPLSHLWDKVGIVMGIGRSRDYQVRLPSGRVWWRNRRFLRPVTPPLSDPLTPGEPCAPTSVPAPRRSERLRLQQQRQLPETSSAQDLTMSV